ncbi:MAG: hypothetical protein ACODAJ_13085 [Planctomycetota bacterium]
MAIRHRRVMCRACGWRGEVVEGGAPGLYLLHCESCGEPRRVTREELGDIYLRYLKGLPEDARQMVAGYDPAAVEACVGAPLTLEALFAAIETHAGRCSCGGTLSLEAPPRCRRCRCDDLADDPDGPGIRYE